MFRSHLTIAIVLFTILTTNAQLDGWTKGKNNTDMAFSISYDKGSGFYAGNDLIGLKRDRYAYSLFAVRGITRNFDIAVGIPYADNSGAPGSLQDASLWLKYLPLDVDLAGKWRFSGALVLGASVPMVDYDTELLGSVGQGNTALMSMGVLQLQHKASGVFLNANSGYYFKSEPTPDLVPFRVSLGIAKAKYYTELYFDMGDSQGGKDYRGQGDLKPSTFKEIGANWQKLGAKFYKPIKSRMGISVELNKVLIGRNYDDSFGMAISFVYKIPARKKEEKITPQ